MSCINVELENLENAFCDSLEEILGVQDGHSNPFTLYSECKFLKYATVEEIEAAIHAAEEVADLYPIDHPMQVKSYDLAEALTAFQKFLENGVRLVKEHRFETVPAQYAYLEHRAA